MELIEDMVTGGHEQVLFHSRPVRWRPIRLSDAQLAPPPGIRCNDLDIDPERWLP